MVEEDDLPKTIGLRIRDEELAEAFEKIKDRIAKETSHRKKSNQNTAQTLLRMGIRRYREMILLEKEFNQSYQGELDPRPDLLE
jgi:two-component sensor histidine kinase